MTGRGRQAGGAILALVLALAVLAAGSAAPGPAVAGGAGTDPSSWRLGPSGIGPLRLGMSAAKARSLVPGLRVAHHRFCDSWTAPGLDGVSMFSTHSRGGLSGVSVSTYSEDLEPGHGAGGVEPGESVHRLKQRYGKRLRFVMSSRPLRQAFYRVYSGDGGRTAIEFTISTRTGRVEFEQAGFPGEFYFTDGVELCA